MVREFSAGGVVLRKMRGRWFLAVIEPHMTRPKKPPSVRPARENKPPAVVALPKGAIDEGEKPEQTALREVSEETGVQRRPGRPSSPTSSMSTSATGAISARVFKIVSFYLLLYRSGRLGNISPEMRVEVQQRLLASAGRSAQQPSATKASARSPRRALQYLKAHPELGDHATNTAH